MTTDPGYRDLDRSAAFDEIVSNLDHFNADPSVKAARRVLYRALQPARGMRILDAGCGPGFDVAALALRVAPGGGVTGIDLSERIIALARSRYGGVEGVTFEAGSVTSLPLPDSRFDAAFSLRTLQYLEEPAPAIRELTRVTKPGGRVAVIEGGMSAIDLAESELKRFVFGPKPSLGVRLPNLLRDCGLERVTVRPSFSTTMGRPDPKTMEYARSRAEVAVDEGVRQADEAETWLRELEEIIEAGRWFTADCIFVVVGTVPAP